MVRCCRERNFHFRRTGTARTFRNFTRQLRTDDLLNRTLHKERTIVQWLSFDEPESRLRKAMKRDGFFSAARDQKAPEQRAQSLAALAFALADIEIFNPLSFKKIPSVLAQSKELHSFNAEESLNKIHPGLFSHLEQELGLPQAGVIWAALSAEFLAQAIENWQNESCIR